MIKIDGKHIEVVNTITDIMVNKIKKNGAKKIEFMDDDNTTVTMWLTPEVLEKLARTVRP